MGKSSFFDTLKTDSPLESMAQRRRASASFPSREISVAMDKRMKRIMDMRIFKLERRISDALSHASSRAYGVILLTFGLLALILYFVGLYPDRSLTNPIVALSCVLLSVLFLSSDRSIPIILQSYAPTDFIFFEFFCMKRMSKAEKNVNLPAALTVVVGVLLAVCGCFVPLWLVVSVVLCAIFVFLSFVSPEFAFFVSLMILPYSGYVPYSEIIFPCVVALAVLSFCRKVLYGKRVISFERYDLLLGLMLLCILVSGIFVKGIESFSMSVGMVIMAMGYMLAGNMITNRRLADRVINTLVFSSTVPAVISLIQLAVIIWNHDTSEQILEHLDGVLARTDGVAVYLLAAFIFSISFVRHSSGANRVTHVTALIVNLVALIVSGEMFALLAILLALAAYSVLKANKHVWLTLPLLLSLPYATFFVVSRYFEELFNLVPSLYTVDHLLSVWKKCISALIANPLAGIGMGTDSFVTEMEKYGIVGLPDSSNLFIEIGLEAGVLALIFFLLILTTRIGHRRKYYNYVRSSQVSGATLVSEVCFFALVAFGCMNYIWSDISAYYLFWVVFGIGSATMRVAKRENDDIVFYYQDTMAVDSSAIDVRVG